MEKMKVLSPKNLSITQRGIPTGKSSIPQPGLGQKKTKLPEVSSYARVNPPHPPVEYIQSSRPETWKN